MMTSVPFFKSADFLLVSSKNLIFNVTFLHEPYLRTSPYDFQVKNQQIENVQVTRTLCHRPPDST